MKGYFVYYENEIVIRNLMNLSDAYVAIVMRVNQGHRRAPHFIYSDYGLVQEVKASEIEAMSK